MKKKLTPREIIDSSTIEQKKEALLLNKIGNYNDFLKAKNYREYLNILKQSKEWSYIDKLADTEVEKLHKEFVDNM